MNSTWRKRRWIFQSAIDNDSIIQHSVYICMDEIEAMSPGPDGTFVHMASGDRYFIEGSMSEIAKAVILNKPLKSLPDGGEPCG